MSSQRNDKKEAQFLSFMEIVDNKITAFDPDASQTMFSNWLRAAQDEISDQRSLNGDPETAILFEHVISLYEQVLSDKEEIWELKKGSDQQCDGEIEKLKKELSDLDFLYKKLQIAFEILKNNSKCPEYTCGDCKEAIDIKNWWIANKTRNENLKPLIQRDELKALLLALEEAIKQDRGVNK